MAHSYLPTPPASPPVVYTQQPQITRVPNVLYANNYTNQYRNPPFPAYPTAPPVYPLYAPTFPPQSFAQPYPHSYPAQHTPIKSLKRDLTTFETNNINVIPPPKRQRLDATNPYKMNDRVEVKEDTIMGPIWLPGTIIDIGTDWFVVHYDKIIGMEKELQQKIYINSLRFTVRTLATTENKSDTETKSTNKNMSEPEPETQSEAESEHEKPPKTTPEKKHRLDVAMADPSKMSKIRQQTFLQKGKNDNSYYYRFNKDGESQRNGAWDSDEHKAFMKRVSEFGVNEKWGLFSVVINGRVGYQCSNYWRQLIKNGEVNDPNYYRDSNGKLKYKKKSQLNVNDKNEYEKFRRFSFFVLNDPSNTFPLPAAHGNGAKIRKKRKIKLKIKKRKKRKVRKSSSGDDNDTLLPAYNVRSGYALVLIICIKDYETLSGKTLSNLYGTVKDKHLMKDLFCNAYKYKVICNDKDIVDLQDFDGFINKARYELFYNYLNYDSFILVFSGHGSKENIYLSDGNGFGRIDLYKFFNGLNCKPFKDKPKLLVIDACKGGDVAPKIESDNNSKYSVAMKCANGLSTHPDDNIIIFNANSDEYVSFDSPNGGVLINSFHDVLNRNKKKICLDDMTKCIDIKMKEMGNKMNVVQTLQNIQHGIKQKIYFCKR